MLTSPPSDCGGSQVERSKNCADVMDVKSINNETSLHMFTVSEENKSQKVVSLCSEDHMHQFERT